MLIFLLLIIIAFLNPVKTDTSVYVPAHETNLTEQTSFCGAGSISKRITFIVIRFFKVFQEDLSHCCAIHDDCYDQQGGKRFCDLEFRRCTHKLNIVFSDVAYKAVQYWGDHAYKEAAKPLPQIIYQLNDPTLSPQFSKLYTFCQNSKAILSSCVIRYEHCVNKARTDCKIWFASCLLYTYSHRPLNDACDNEVENFIKTDLKIDNVPFLPE